MKILILGHGRHGKDTAADIISSITGLVHGSSSRVALDAIWPCLNLIKKYDDKETAFECRNATFENRMLWKELISLYNTPDKSALCRLILERNDIYVGMRCDKEYEVCKDLFDHVFWIDAVDRHPEEPSMLIKYTPDMLYIDNNQDLDYMEEQIEKTMTAIIGVP